MFKSIIIAILICFSLTVHGQVSFYGACGINISNFTFQNYAYDIEASSSVNPFLTIGMALPITQKLYFLGELNYSSYINRISAFGSPQGKIKYHQVNLQAGFSHQFDRLRIDVGGYIGKSLEDHVRFENKDFSGSGGLEDFSIGAFLGLNIDITKRIGLFSRYYYALSDISRFYLADLEGFPVTPFDPLMANKINNLQFGISVRLI